MQNPRKIGWRFNTQCCNRKGTTHPELNPRLAACSLLRILEPMMKKPIHVETSLMIRLSARSSQHMEQTAR